MLVYVQNKGGKPLMPCSPAKARALLKAGKAKVAIRTPFTIRLRHGSSGYTQPVKLGIDAGSKTIGLSATTKGKELFSAELELRTDIQSLLSERRQYRRARRNRKTRYRAPRFQNRTKEIVLMPSVRNKIETHLKAAKLVNRILPVKETTVEVAAFDMQKIRNPEISGERYQQGAQTDFWNVREYVLFRDGHKCLHCKGKSGDKALNVHHIESRQTGGDSPSNLATLCETCHGLHHKGKIKLEIKRGTSLRDAAQMGIMRWEVLEELKKAWPNVKHSYGYQTKSARIEAKLEKTHRADARCISGSPKVKTSGTWFQLKAVRRNNRMLHKAKILKGGIRKANKAPRLVKGFRLFDKVKFEGRECFIVGRRTTGHFDLRTLSKEKIHNSASFKKLELLETAKTILIERKEEDAFLPALNGEVSCVNI